MEAASVVGGAPASAPEPETSAPAERPAPEPAANEPPVPPADEPVANGPLGSAPALHSPDAPPSDERVEPKALAQPIEPPDPEEESEESEAKGVWERLSNAWDALTRGAAAVGGKLCDAAGNFGRGVTNRYGAAKDTIFEIREKLAESGGALVRGDLAEAGAALGKAGGMARNVVAKADSGFESMGRAAADLGAAGGEIGDTVGEVVAATSGEPTEAAREQSPETTRIIDGKVSRNTEEIAGSGQLYEIRFDSPTFKAVGSLIEGKLSLDFATRLADENGNYVRIRDAQDPRGLYTEAFTGSRALDEILGHFGSEVETIASYPLEDHLAESTALLAAGRTPVQAASESWLGRQLIPRGFRVESVSISDMQISEVLWRRE